MGLLRFYLAAAVISWHTGGLAGYTPIRGYVSVQVFYIISGFYMALILNTKYVGPGSYRVFIANRLLRIFPAYWVVLLLTIGASVVAQKAVGHSRLSEYLHDHLSPLTWISLIATNLGIIGQDAILFFDLSASGNLIWPANFSSRTGTPLHEFMLLPQGWSLSLELMFYVIAPLLVRRRLGIVLAMIAACSALRVVVAKGLGYDVDPWNSRFFPCELSLFLAGTVAYHLYQWLRAHPPAKGWLIAVGSGFGLMSLAHEYIFQALSPEAREVFHWSYFALATVAIPFLFLWTGKNKLDRYIGELSFPLYILHILVLMFVANLQRRYAGDLTFLTGLVTLIVTTPLSMLMIKYVIDPIETFRHHLTPKDLGAEKATSG